MRTPMRRSSSSSSSTAKVLTTSVLKNKKKKPEEEKQLEEAMEWMEEWKASNKNPVAVLVAFKRVYDGHYCSVSLERKDKEGYVFTTRPSEKVMEPLLSLVSKDVDDGKKKPQKQPRWSSTQKKKNEEEEEEEENEEEDEAYGSTEEEESSSESDSDSEEQPSPDETKTKTKKKKGEKETNKGKSKEKVYVVKEKSRGGLGKVVPASTSTTPKSPTKPVNEEVVTKTAPLAAQASTRTPEAATVARPLVEKTVLVATTKVVSTPLQTSTSPSVSASKTQTSTLEPSSGLGLPSTPSNRSNANAGDLEKEREEENEGYCRDFLKSHFGGGKERFKASIDDWLSLNLGATLEKGGGGGSSPSLSGQPSTQVLNEKRTAQEEEEEEELMDKGTVPSIPEIACNLLTGATNQLKELFVQLLDLRSQKKEIQRKRWKVECVLVLRVAELRETVRKEKQKEKQKEKTKQWNWAHFQKALCQELDCKLTRMKQILTAGKLFREYGVLLFLHDKIPHHKALDKFAKKFEALDPLQKDGLKKEFEWLQVNDSATNDLVSYALERARSFHGVERDLARLLGVAEGSSSPSTTSSSMATSSPLLSQLSPDLLMTQAPPLSHGVLGKRTREVEVASSSPLSSSSSSSSSSPSSSPDAKSESSPAEKDTLEGEKRGSLEEALKRLEEGKELDDEAVMFYAHHLLDKLPEEVQSKIHLFNTFFFPILDKRKDKSSLEKEEVVRSLMKPMGNLFSKEYLVFPVHDKGGHHWILVVVDGPDQAKKEASKGCVFRIFDSLFGSEKRPFHDQIYDCTMDFLNRAWSIEFDEGGEEKEKPFHRESVELVLEKVPQQNNFVDCGLYVHKCLEKFFESPQRSMDLKDFSSADVSSLRKTLSLLIRESLGMGPPPSFSASLREEEEEEEEATPMASQSPSKKKSKRKKLGPVRSKK